MGNKVIRLSDKLYSKDILTLPKTLDKSTGFDTIVRIHEKNCKYAGSDSSIITHNTTALMGRNHLLEASFKVTPNMSQHIFINDNILGTTDPTTGNNRDAITLNPNGQRPYNDAKLFARRKVEYWCAGDGAMNKTILNSSYAPHNTDVKLFNMIPFRFIRADESLSDADRRLYKCEVIYPQSSPYYGYKGYYFKKIVYDTSKTGVNLVVDGVDYAPKWIDTVPDLNADTITGAHENAFKGDRVQQSYVDMTLNVTSVEFKEYFMFTNSSLGNATISEIGLVLGLDCVKGFGNRPIEDEDRNGTQYNTNIRESEIYDSELFAHLTFDPYNIARDNTAIEFSYRVFA